MSPAEATFATFQYTGPPGGNDPQLGDEYGYLAGKVMTAQATLELLTGSAGGPWTASATSWSIAVGGTLFLDSSTLPLTIYENIFMGTGPVLEQYRLRAGTESGGTFSEAFFTYWIDPNVNNFGYDMAQTWTPATAARHHPRHVASGDQTVIFA